MFRLPTAAAISAFSAFVLPLHAYELPELPPMPAIPAPQPVDSVPLGNINAFPEVKMGDAIPIAPGPVEPTWSSIASNLPVDAVQLREGKFGIWVHFGPQAAGNSGDWYARNLYKPGTAYNNHLANYGHPSEVGYKDVLNTWNPSALDPAGLVSLYQQAGARFLLIQGVHHDQFDMWDSRYQPWNSTNIGPQRDLLGEWTTAARAADIKFGVTFHHEYSWWWWQTAFNSDTSGAMAGVPYDGHLTLEDGVGKWWEGYDPRLLYGIDLREYQGVSNAAASGWSPPPAGLFSNHLDYAHWYNTWWALRMIDVIENYDPDFIYTDGTSSQPFSGSGTGTGYKSDAMQRVLAHHINRGVERHGQVDRFAMVKFHSGDRLTTTFENNYPSGIKRDQPWIGEVPVGDWFYAPGFNYNPGMVIRYLLECVSRDGAAAISIPQKPDGSLDAACQTMLESIGNWMDINSPGIYGSRAWVRHADGTRSLPHGKLGNTQANYAFTTSDFRYTVGSDGYLYAYCMTVPAAGETITLPSLGSDDGNLAAPITTVEMLGNAGALTWNQTATELTIVCPATMPYQTAVAFKIGPTAIVATSAPTNVTATPAASAITLTWHTPDNGVTFTVKRSSSAGGPYSEIATALTEPTFTDTTVVANTPYYYVVTATKGDNTSPDSEYTIGLLPGASTWQTQDIGTVGATGSHTESASYHLVKGSGSDIWGNSDSFRFAYQPFAGNCTITAKVVSSENTAAWAKAGIMIRETLDSNSKYAIAYVSPSNGTALQQRSGTGGAATGISNIPGIGAPYWLKLIRIGPAINAFQSPDGQTWTSLGSTSIPMANDVYVGLAVCSVNNGILNESLFSNVSIAVPSEPTGISWQPPATVTSDSAIDLTGTLVHAGNFRLSGNVTVTIGDESIPFTNRAASNAFSGLATGEEAKVVSGSGGKQTNTGLFNAAGTTVSAAFESVLDGSAWENTDPGPAPGATDMILRVTGAAGAPLADGQLYQIQLFYSDDRAGNTSRAQLYHDGLGNASASVIAGDSTAVIGTFTASSYGHQDIHIQNTSGGSNFPVAINAYVLRAIDADTDDDGLPDAWETAHFGGLGQGPHDDYDGDGTNNLTEYRLGLDPTDGSSRFAATADASARLEWPGAEGLAFTVLRSLTLTDDWVPIATVPGTAGKTEFTDPSPPAGTAFYRIRLEP